MRGRADGNGGFNPCDGINSDCLKVSVKGNPIPGWQNLSVPGSLTSFGPTVLGVDDQPITLLFEGSFSFACGAAVFFRA